MEVDYSERGIAPSLSGGLPLVLTLIGVALLVTVALTSIHDPWIDESALILNFVAESKSPTVLDKLFEPMAIAHQATPLAHRFLGRIVAGALVDRFGIEAVVLVLRLFSVAASIATAYFVFRTVRIYGSVLESAAGAIISTASPFLVSYAFQAKHYVMEGTATAAVAYGACLLAQDLSSVRRLMAFVAAAAAGYFISFTLLMVVGACSAALCMLAIYRHVWINRRQGLGAAKDFLGTRWRLIVGCALATLFGLAMYVLYSKPIVGANLQAFPEIYAEEQLSLGGIPPALIRRLVGMLTPIDLPIWEGGLLRAVLMALFGILWAFFLYRAMRRAPVLAISGAMLLLVIAAAHAMGVFPFSHLRHTYFAAPLFAVIFVLGLGSVLPRPKTWPNLIPTVVLGATIAVYGISSAASSYARPWEEASPMLRRIAEVSPEAPVWVHPLAAPAVLLLAGSRIRYLGGVPEIDVVTPRPWSEYIEKMTAKLEGVAEVWLLFVTDAESERKSMIESAETHLGPCELVLREQQSRLFRCRRS